MPKKTQFVSRLQPDQEVHDLFLVHLKQLTSGRTGKSYLRLTIGDRTGRIEARVWDGAHELAQRFNQGDLVYVTGLATSYQGVTQIKATYVEAAPDDGRIDWTEFLPAAERPAPEMFEELNGLLGTVTNPDLKRLVDAFLADGELMEGFMRAPAAVSMHHAYMAGLLEHTLGVVRLADRVAPLYPVDRDLVLVGAFLHDLGKLKELAYAASFDYTDEGRLLGHLVMGYGMIDEKCAQLPGFPHELKLHLEHLMLSHHGELEWGSPKRPKTKEALMLHALDNVDAKVIAAEKFLNEPATGNGQWTGYLRMFDRPLSKTPDFSQPPPVPLSEVEEFEALFSAGEAQKAEPETETAPVASPTEAATGPEEPTGGEGKPAKKVVPLLI